ncbi:MAG: hypothetical protein K1W10_09025 [Lachnospiraceae bacterium]
MFGFLDKIDRKHIGVFAAGILFGTAGIKILSSKDAKKVYTHGTAAALRAKDFCMKTAAAVQENAEDIYAEAVQINEERARQEAEQMFSGAKDWEEETASEGKEHLTEMNNFTETGVSGEQGI